MSGKKGLSTIIVTMIMIVLVLVATGIIWIVIANLIDTESERASLGLGNLLLNLKIENVDVEEDEIRVAVQRKVGEGDLRGIKFIFSDGITSESDKKEIVLEELDLESFTFTLNKISVAEAKTVSIAPIYSSEEIIGAITDTFVIQEISNGNGGTSETCGDGICDVGESCSVDCDETGDGGTNGDGGNGGDGDIGGGECTPNLNACTGFNCGEVSNGTCGSISCGTCIIGEICNDLNQCEADSVINSGIIESVWPPTAVKYFDSEDLPKDVSIISSYIGKYVNFSGAETRCLRVTYAEYLDEPLYDKSYIRVELISEISNGDSYEIWQTDTCGS